MSKKKKVWQYTKKVIKALVVGDVNKPGRDIMEALARFRYLTSEQLARYLSLSHNYTQMQLKRVSEK